MTSSSNNQFTPSSIANNKFKFRIPLYQRPYAWEAEQIENLLNDLLDAFTNKQKEYHIGVLSTAKTVDDPFCFDLIDGQQRITTLILIGMAASEYHEDWNSFITTDRLDLYGREEDKVFLEKGTNPKANKNMQNNLSSAKAFFFEKKVIEGDRNNFARFIYEKAAFFLAEVPSNYSLMDKNRQFVRMNNRGKQLEKHEILKVKLLNPEMIPCDKERGEFIKVWNDMVSYLTGSVSSDQPLFSLKDILEESPQVLTGDNKINSEILYTRIVNIPEFLLIALARSRKDPDKISPDKSKLIATFLPVLKNHDDIVAFMEVLKSQLNFLKKFFVSRDKNGKYGKYELIGENNEGNDRAFCFSRLKNKAHLIAVQSFLHVSTEPHHWLIPAFNWLEDCNEPICADNFIAEFEKIDNNNLINDKRNLGDLPALVDMTYDKRINHYWFYRLDYELWKLSRLEPSPENIWKDFRASANKEKDKRQGILALLTEFQFRRCGSIEHMWPQTPREGSRETDNTFGNLALISSSRNSKFSNTHPDGKKGDIVTSEYTESLKMLHFLYSDQDATKNAELLYDILSKAVNSPPTVLSA